MCVGGGIAHHTGGRPVMSGVFLSPPLLTLIMPAGAGPPGSRAASQTSPCLPVSTIISHDWLPVPPLRSKVRRCLCPHDEDRMEGWVGPSVCVHVCVFVFASESVTSPLGCVRCCTHRNATTPTVQPQTSAAAIRPACQLHVEERR